VEREHLETNRAYWDEVAGLHRESYDTAAFMADPTCLGKQVGGDAALLAPWLPDGSVAGLDLVHLQCHIGDDTLGWARLGAKVTGLDMSAESLRVARELADEAGLAGEFVQSTIADAAAALTGRTFDVVYTSVGVLGWLDDLDAWARLIEGLLKPGGVFFIREAHPMAMALDAGAPAGELRLGWPYFNTGPVMEELEADYSSPEPLTSAKTVAWAHGLGEIIGSLLGAGMQILDFREHKTLPWRFLPWMEREGDGRWARWALPEPLRHLCPLEFSLVATKASAGRSYPVGDDTGVAQFQSQAR
jgi:2-polyprenyl-3-methyl-5-hydroxy-6-metoxy-1,4-benzoquinol methylase